MRKVLSILTFTIVSSLTCTTNAQVKTTQDDEGYGYEFEDDPLSTTAFGPNDSRIRIRRAAQRSTLIKPRISFIKELVEDIEQL